MAKKRIKSESSPAAHVATQLARQAHRTIVALDATEDDDLRAIALRDRLASLEAEASWHPTGSPEAALFQLGVAIVAANKLAELAVLTRREEEASRLFQTTDRLLGSITRYLEAITGVRREDFGLERYRNDDIERESWGLTIKREVA